MQSNIYDGSFMFFWTKSAESVPGNFSKVYEGYLLRKSFLTLFIMEGGGGEEVGVGVGGTLCPQQILLFLVGASEILRKWDFQRIPKIYQGFWIKDFFSKILHLGGSGSFVRTFSEIWKTVFL